MKPICGPMPTACAAEAAELGAGAAVVGDLLEEIAGDAEMDGLADEVRGGPVDMEVDAVLVLQCAVHEIVGEAADHGEFVAGLRVEIGIAGADIDRRESKD